jgi:hypothetical protein
MTTSDCNSIASFAAAKTFFFSIYQDCCQLKHEMKKKAAMAIETEAEK